jgi:monoamine oxidase
MPRTVLAEKLQDAMSVVREANSRQAPAGQVIDERHARSLSRRDFLRLSLVAAGALAFRPRPAANPITAPRIVIVGAGLAGLACAYELRKAGYTAQVYEASDRIGGRCWTIRGAFDQGQIAEHGGELIDQGHTAVRHLAQELGLKLDNLLQAEKNGADPFYYFDGAPYTYAQAVADLNGVYQTLHRDLIDAGYPTLYSSYTPRGYALDHLSIVDWINQSVAGGMSSKLGQLLDVAYNIEYGAETSQQSSLNLVYLLGYSGQGQLNIFGASNEKYHIQGGNDQLATGMAGRLTGQINLGNELTAIRRNSDGTYTLTFKSGKTSRDVAADRVVMAIPFSILRSSVDTSRAGFKPLKQTAIAELAMGTNSKLHLQFTSRHWESLGCQGDTYSDTGYQNTWEVTRAQPGTAGILVDYTGGNIGAGFGQGTPASRAQQFLQQIEPVLPGVTSKWNGKVTLDYWAGYPWTRGSYSYWKVGQYTKFTGVERETEGQCYFAGEHTSIDFQGYLNGAVDTGQTAASNVLSSL